MAIDDHKKPDGNYDGPGVFSEITGIPKDEVKTLMQQVQENHRKLESCSYHEFEQSGQTSMLRSLTHQKYICRHCGGEIDYQRWRWHELGRRPKPTTPETAKDKE